MIHLIIWLYNSTTTDSLHETVTSQTCNMNIYESGFMDRYTICLINRGQINSVSSSTLHLCLSSRAFNFSNARVEACAQHPPHQSVMGKKIIATSYKPFSVAVLCVCKCTATVFRKSIGFTNVLNLLVHEVSHATSNSGSPIKTQATHMWYDLSSPASPLTVGCPVNDHQIWKAGWAWPSVWKCCLPNSIGKLPFVSSTSPRPWS